MTPRSMVNDFLNSSKQSKLDNCSCRRDFSIGFILGENAFVTKLV